MGSRVQSFLPTAFQGDSIKRKLGDFISHVQLVPPAPGGEPCVSGGSFMWGPCECGRKRALTWPHSPAGSGPHACAGGPASAGPGLLHLHQRSRLMPFGVQSLQTPSPTQELWSPQSCWPRHHQASHATPGVSSLPAGPAGRQAGRTPSLAHFPVPGAQHSAWRVHRVQRGPREGCLETQRNGAKHAAAGGGQRSPRPPQRLPHLTSRPSSLTSHKHGWMTTGMRPSSPLAPQSSVSLLSLRHSPQWILVFLQHQDPPGCLWVPGRGRTQTQICLTFYCPCQSEYQSPGRSPKAQTVPPAFTCTQTGAHYHNQYRYMCVCVHIWTGIH